MELVVDALLVLGFGVQHSVLATMAVKSRIKKWSGMSTLAWRSVESLVNVVYILAAASLWQKSETVIWELDGVAAGAVLAVAVASWLWYWQLHLFEYDSGLAFGSTTLVAGFARQPQPALVPWKIGSRRWIRFPVHTAFFGMFFALPTMTADLLVLAVVLNAYNVVGSVLYDLRLEKIAGEPYKAYERYTGLIWPPVYRAPAGAVDLAMPSPRHWRRPSSHLLGVAVGVVIAAWYYAAIGVVTLTVGSMLLVGLTGLAAALVGGGIVGLLKKPDPEVAWDQQQTDLSTTVAVGAALGVALWAGASWVLRGSFPPLVVFLPLWFIVQYLGHVIAVAFNFQKWSGRSLPSGQVPEQREATGAQSVSDPASGVPARL